MMVRAAGLLIKRSLGQKRSVVAQGLVRVAEPQEASRLGYSPEQLQGLSKDDEVLAGVSASMAVAYMPDEGT